MNRIYSILKSRRFYILLFIALFPVTLYFGYNHYSTTCYCKYEFVEDAYQKSLRELLPSQGEMGKAFLRKQYSRDSLFKAHFSHCCEASRVGEYEGYSTLTTLLQTTYQGRTLTHFINRCLEYDDVRVPKELRKIVIMKNDTIDQMYSDPHIKNSFRQSNSYRKFLRYNNFDLDSINKKIIRESSLLDSLDDHYLRKYELKGSWIGSSTDYKYRKVNGDTYILEATGSLESYKR